ncbi:MAG: hypothetical protein ACK2TV_09575 [Anaerolineales bacterium]
MNVAFDPTSAGQVDANQGTFDDTDVAFLILLCMGRYPKQIPKQPTHPICTIFLIFRLVLEPKHLPVMVT